MRALLDFWSITLNPFLDSHLVMYFLHIIFSILLQEFTVSNSYLGLFQSFNLRIYWIFDGHEFFNAWESYVKNFLCLHLLLVLLLRCIWDQLYPQVLNKLSDHQKKFPEELKVTKHLKSYHQKWKQFQQRNFYRLIRMKKRFLKIFNFF